jgi:HPr kinase/phosphorylase
MAKKKGLTLGKVLLGRKGELGLSLVSGKKGVDRPLDSPDIHRPGLALAGYVRFFPKDRVQVMGKTEMSYLSSLDSAARAKAVAKLFSYPVPCIIVTDSQKTPVYMRKISDSVAIPILVTSMKTGPFIRELTEYLSSELAPEKVIHGTLVDVFGIGLLLTGPPGIGKSELALTLVDRGHRLVADDLVRIKKRSAHILIGSGNIEPEAGLGHHMEIRGLGLIDVYAIYGITGIRLQKRVEVEVELVKWTRESSEVQLSMEEKSTDLMGVSIPYVHIPLVPGKNAATLCEVVAMNHLLKVRGYDPALKFDEKLIEFMGAHEKMDSE